MAIDIGRTVIVDHVKEKVSLNLQSILMKKVAKYGGQPMIQFSRKQYKLDENFLLFAVSYL